MAADRAPGGGDPGLRPRRRLGGSGFIAAFVGGMVFGRASGARGAVVTLFTEEAGGLLAAVTWIVFGALALDAGDPAHHLAGRPSTPFSA